SAILIMASLMFINCTSDFETEEKTNAEKAAELRLKILELAEDYDINVKLEDKYDGGNIDIDIEDIEGLFKAISAVRGNYKMIASNNGKTNSLKQVPKRNNRVKTKGEENETFENFGYIFTVNGNPENSPYFRVSNGYWDFECSCMADWFWSSTGHLVSPSVHPQIDVISKPGGPLYSGNIASSNFDYFGRGGMSFSFDGDVEYCVSLSNLSVLHFYFNVYGMIHSETKGDITWILK
ncbi:hypothetical protein, partial [Xylanibacter muris]